MTIDLREGKAEDVLPTLPDALVDCVVTDPPAGIAFMGKAWDRDRGGRNVWIEWLSGILAECLRIAKPGAHALVWALPRTSHWTGVALEDAGWIIEDRIAHHFGQGFPKHKSKLKPATEDWWLCTKPGGAKWLNVDGCRVQGVRTDTRIRSTDHMHGGNYANWSGGVVSHTIKNVDPSYGRWPTNAVFTHHPDCRPCGERRVKTAQNNGSPAGKSRNGTMGEFAGSVPAFDYADADGLETVQSWECVDECPVRLLDEQSGERKGDSVGRKPHLKAAENFGWSGSASEDHETAGFTDSGTASRFFPVFSWSDADFAPFLYQAKASRKERNAGLEGLVSGGRQGVRPGSPDPSGKFPDHDHRERGGNFHPTCKPIALMSWLVRLVTPPGGVVLDPFGGSGTTALAADAEGFDAVLIEQDPEYIEIARRRLVAVWDKTPLFR